MKKKLFELVEPITNITRVGGYYRWDWKLPFRHFVVEELYVATRITIYKITL